MGVIFRRRKSGFAVGQSGCMAPMTAGVLSAVHRNKPGQPQLRPRDILTIRYLIVCDRRMKLIRLILLVLAATTPVAAKAQAPASTMNFEEAVTILGASCGKDIDTNCRGVNLDPT